MQPASSHKTDAGIGTVMWAGHTKYCVRVPFSVWPQYARFVQILGFPRMQNSHLAPFVSPEFSAFELTHFMQAKPGSIATRWPTVLLVTFDPTFEILPADSWPRTGGAFAGLDSQTWASEPQIPIDITSTRTSSSLSSLTSRCWISTFDGAVQITERFEVIPCAEGSFLSDSVILGLKKVSNSMRLQWNIKQRVGDIGIEGVVLVTGWKKIHFKLYNISTSGRHLNVQLTELFRQHD